ELVALCQRWGLDVVEIGTVADHGLLRVIDAGVVVGELPVAALNEPPSYVREGVEAEAVRAARQRDLSSLTEPDDLGAVLLTLLEAPTIADKAAVYRRY